MSAVAVRMLVQAMRIEKVKQHIGAIVTGIDLAHPIDAATPLHNHVWKAIDVACIADSGREWCADSPQHRCFPGDSS